MCRLGPSQARKPSPTPGRLTLVVLAVLDGREVETISFWDHEGNVQTPNSSSYQEVSKILARLLDGNTYVKSFDVVSSTFQRVALAQPAEANPVQEHCV